MNENTEKIRITGSKKIVSSLKFQVFVAKSNQELKVKKRK